METPNPFLPRLSDLPLWRLLVALDDAERLAGPDSASARVLARAVSERMKQARGEPAADLPKGGATCRP